MADIKDITGARTTSVSQTLSDMLSSQAMAITGGRTTSVSQTLSDVLSSQVLALTGGGRTTSISQTLSDMLSSQAMAITATTSVSQTLSDILSSQVMALAGDATTSVSQTLSDMLSSQAMALTATTSTNSFLNGILNVQNVPLNVAIDYDWLEATSKCSDKEVEEIYETTLDEITAKKDYHSLSLNAKNLVIFVLCFILTDVVWDIAKGLATNEIYALLTNANTILPSKSAPEIKAIARGKSTPEFDRSMIKGYRIVFSEGLNFRDAPAMKSEIITILKSGTSLEVVDDSNRTWIQVAVIIDGEEELGWVSKRYTVLVR